MPKFSANLGFLWPDLPLLDRIDAAARAGFRAIELHWPFETPATDIRGACERNGLTLLGINTPPGDRSKGEFGLAALPGREDAFRESFRMTLDYARDAGASAIHVMAGIVPPGDRDAARQALIANLEWASNQAPDLALLIEAINDRDAPGYFYARPSEAEAIRAAVGAPNLKLMFDCYHAGVMGEDVIATLEKYLPAIGHIQIAAVPTRHEPDEGYVDYRIILEAIDRLGYDGWVGCEYRPRAGTDEGLIWAAQLGIALGADAAMQELEDSTASDSFDSQIDSF